MGPECTGKTRLAQLLATHYKTVCVAEYAREYCEKLKRKYTLDDIEFIARKQLEIENELLKKANKIIFSDTELIISKIWAEDVFKTLPKWIAENLEQTKYNLYLLLSTDIPWQADSVRENGDRREYFFDLYESEIKKLGAPYSVIAGAGEIRMDNCISCIEKFLNKK